MDCGGGQAWLAGRTSCATLVGLESLLIFASLREVQSRTSPGIPPGPSLLVHSGLAEAWLSLLGCATTAAILILLNWTADIFVNCL